MKKRNMCDFVNEQCQAVDDKNKFVSAWLKTHGDPCAVCERDKANCPFFKKLQEEKETEKS